LPEAEIDRAQIRLDRLKVSWRESAPTKELRALAEELLVEHQLRAADALQLAAAALMKRLSDVPIPFVCLDDRLTDAARAEGFGIAIDNRG
jgi:predicted nucleic acid-binding protein